MDAVDTIAAIATSAGAGGVGIVRVSGPRVPIITEALTGKTLRPRVAVFTRFRDEAGEAIDEGIALYFAAPHSYTGEDVLELQGHGGPVVLRTLLKRCLDTGARLAEPGEFTKRAFLNGKLDLTQAEAVVDLISASTEQAARSAARSMTGEFSRRVESFQAELNQLRVLIEASIDFPEEGIDFLAEADVPGRLDRLLDSVQRALRAGGTGRLLQEGVSVALVGPPNVGKSSIINVLCEDDVAIVTPIPGTTRDLVRGTISVEGVPIHVVDTAGLREAEDVVEESGIARTWSAISSADLILVVCVAGERATLLSQGDASQLPSNIPRIYVHNKIDLAGDEPRLEEVDGQVHVWISAKLGQGIDRLESAIAAAIGVVGDTGSAFAARERQLRALEAACVWIRHARSGLQEVEFASEDLRAAQRSLSEITGEVLADDILGEIFSQFCIGK